MTEPTLQETENFVRSKFEGVNDRSDVPMADHMMRVAERVEEGYKRAAWLHDIVEDTDVTLADLEAMGYSAETVEIVRLVTHDKKAIDYSTYIDRIVASGNRGAIHVKIADQQDDLDPKRWLTLNRFVQNALRRRYAGVMDKLMAAAVRLER